MIKAEVHSDDRSVEVEFDATPYFIKSRNPKLFDLALCGFGLDYPSDEVAISMAEHNEEIQFLFKYLEVIADDPMKKNHRGFECTVDVGSAMKWIKNERPELYEKIINDEDCPIEPVENIDK